MLTALGQRAIELAQIGLAVFPIAPLGKIPVAGSRGFKDATRDVEQIERWWQARPNLNIGVATGETSGIFVLDIDTGEKEMRQLEVKHGSIPLTVESATPRGGRHIFFAHPGWPVKCSQGEFARGIDVRGDGGYVVVPPSVRENSRRYYWKTPIREFAQPPDWVLDKLKSPTSDSAKPPVPTEQWRDLVHNGVDEGCRNSTVAKLAGHLLRRYVDPHVTLELLIAWDQAYCRPPLGPHDIRVIVNSIAGKELRRRSA